MNDVFEVADRIAVLYLGRWSRVRPAAEMDRQIVVDLMTTGQSTGDAGTGRRQRWTDAVTEPTPTPRPTPVEDDASRPQAELDARRRELVADVARATTCARRDRADPGRRQRACCRWSAA